MVTEKERKDHGREKKMQILRRKGKARLSFQIDPCIDIDLLLGVGCWELLKVNTSLQGKKESSHGFMFVDRLYAVDLAGRSWHFAGVSHGA